MAARGYFPVSQMWAPGQWSTSAFIIALLLCVTVIGILVFIYMVLVKPAGTLTVTYERREEKICPRCAERVKTAALVCRFCGHQFPSAEKITGSHWSD
jgi:ribosomal protein L40E